MNTIGSVRREMARLSKKGLLDLPKDFCIGEYVRKPNGQGCFQKGKKWYIFRIDERNESQITGPFSRQGIVYACAMMLHQTSYLEDCRFSEEERSVYIHDHYRSPEELPFT